MVKVILSSNIFHYNYTARALQNMRVLERYIAGVQFSKQKQLFNMLPSKYRSYLLDHVDKELESKKLKSLWGIEILYKILLGAFKSKKDYIIKFHNMLFDKVASQQIGKCDFFHFVSTVGYHSAIKSKKNGAKIIVDDRAQHPVFLEHLLSEECRLLNVKDENIVVPLRDNLLKEYALADYFIVSSTFAKRTFVEHGIDESKIFVLPYGFNGNKFYPLKKEDHTFRVIYVGQIIPRKGVTYLLEAFNKFSNNKSDTELVLIGKIDPCMKAYFENLPSNVIHHNYIPNHELIHYYSNSSVFVLPSISDAFGLVVLEAMGSGLPVIVTENVGAADVIDEGTDGFVVPIRNNEAIYQKLSMLYNDKDLQQRMSMNSIKKAKMYTWDYYMKNLQKVYSQIMRL
ncbi:glycosyltransferase family 4 protein [Paenibacillus alkalitolerans]|uniref:glycosyltransferase family 4 protein n=1 Tax=Paenibacillus alkalitolerans TaxID=2799335 RepID=UPI0018F61041|nr:glycosyltransferase family 4 protein [Paenibacillus alkalitolerans]